MTQDIQQGEYGHRAAQDGGGRRQACYDLAADPQAYPESAETWGTWQVKKLYLHLWGEEADQIRMDWERPLAAAFGGKTGLDVAEEAYAMHVTHGSGGRNRGKRDAFSV